MAAKPDIEAKSVPMTATPPSPLEQEAEDTVSAISARALRSKASLVTGNRQALQEDFVPHKLLHRDDQILALVNVLGPAYEGNLPSHILIYGRTGTGKTAVATQVLKDIKRKATAAGVGPVEFLVVNCKNAPTSYALLRELVNSIKTADQKRLGEKMGVGAAMTHLKAALTARGGLTLLCLDEVDHLVKKEGDEALYSLTNLNSELKGAHVGVIGISNDLQFTENLDARVKSRLNEQTVVFPPYDAKQLQDILRERSKMALAPTALEDGVIEHIAQEAAQKHGDARQAIALLRLAVQLAEKQGAKKVTDRHVGRAKQEVDLSAVDEGIRKLPPHQKIYLWSLLALTKLRRDAVTSGDIYASYEKICAKLGITPTSVRSASDYLSDFDTANIITYRMVYRGYGKGRTRVISPSVPVDAAMELLQNSEELLHRAAIRVTGQKTLEDALGVLDKSKGAA